MYVWMFVSMATVWCDGFCLDGQCLFGWPPAYFPSCQALRGREPVEHSSPVRRFRVIAGMKDKHAGMKTLRRRKTETTRKTRTTKETRKTGKCRRNKKTRSKMNARRKWKTRQNTSTMRKTGRIY